MGQPQHTPERIETLERGQVFVFGSNREGNHAGGAARDAVERFGAEMGQGEGQQGQSYAIPTMEGIDALKGAVLRFLDHARQNTGTVYLVTKIGCGIAGHSVDEIAPLFAGRSQNVVVPVEFDVPATVQTFKGFERDWKCRGFQFAVGGTFVHEGKVKACEGGFHACEYPLDVFRYYPPSTSVYAATEQSGDISRHAEDTKVASRTIKVLGEIGIPGLVKAAIEYTTSRCLPIDPASPASATGGRGAASATGGRGAASATGYQGAASATGDQGAASATGYQGAASATGYQGAASATGDQGAASATGDQGAASATGDQGAAMASGYEGRVRGADGNALFLVERDDDYKITAVWAGIAGREGIKADTWYALNDGVPVEVT